MKRIIGLVLIAFLAVGGCSGGGGGDECNFDFDSFLNGPNAQLANSEWDCTSAVTGEFVFQAFEDGTGLSSDIGPLTWQQSGCRSAAFQSGFGDGDIINLEGSKASGIITYDQVSNVPELDIGAVGCKLRVF